MKSLLTFLFLCFYMFSMAQNDENILDSAKKNYEAKQFSMSEKKYRTIASNNLEYKSVSKYNMGNAIYKMKQYDEALVTYFNATEIAKTKEQKHKAFHNLGNVLMKEKDYESAVESYKNALRNNPYDEETRYNFALAKKFLKENPPKNPPRINGDNKKPEDDKSQDKNKGQNKEKEQDSGSKQPNEGNNTQEDKKTNKAKNQKSQDVLNALNEAEKQIQKRISEEKEQQIQIKNEKDW